MGTSPRRLVALVATVMVALFATLSGCGAASSSMSQAQMRAMTSSYPSHGSGAQPSAIASMICGDEIADAVKHTYGLVERPVGSSTWSPPTHLFSCTYSVRHSRLTLQVKDLNDQQQGRAYFDRLSTRIHAKAIGGVEALGFPAFQDPQGQVGFLKDGKTLYVDGAGVSQADLPAGTTRLQAAYGVAAAVIACWKE